jgi:aspartyl-tRNA(Asn)/glutamyl-tRNA(Gln) amidotransferase subunit A
VRELVTREFAAAFERVDVIAGPTTPTPAFKIGEKVDDPVAMYLADTFTLPANIAGICGLSVPCGLARELPVGLQILAPQLGEEIMFRVAAIYERSTGWALRPSALERT